mmetsp:Transcript_25815/g.72918  ORF Transcript_25815/g.72918 Transcript_25815/m.72918 type:complete len:277 (+) Transcript_25815:37-867(+)
MSSQAKVPKAFEAPERGPSQSRPPDLVGHAVHPDVLVEELPVEVAPHRVVDEPHLLLGDRARLVLEHGVVVPLALEGDVTSSRQRVPLHDLLAPVALLLLFLLLALLLLRLLALLLDLLELPHEFLGVLVPVVVRAFGPTRDIVVGVLGERVVFDGRPVLAIAFPLLQGLCPLLRLRARPAGLLLLAGLLLAALEVLADLPPRAALLRRALPELPGLEGEEAGGVTVRDLCGLRDEQAAARVRAAPDGGGPGRPVRGSHCGRRSATMRRRRRGSAA